jgi:hemoglobin
MSLYDDLGGEPAVDAAVDLFYDKVLADSRINQFFEHTDMVRQKRMQKQFLTLAFGGPNHYSGAGMRKAHQSLSLEDEHFDAVMENLGATLVELGVPQDKVQEAAAVAESVRADVLNK